MAGPADDEAEIAAFHRAARKRKAVIFAIASVVSFAVGVMALLVAFTAEAPDGSARYEVRVMVLGGILIAAAVWAAVAAYRIGTGQIADVD